MSIPKRKRSLQGSTYGMTAIGIERLEQRLDFAFTWSFVGGSLSFTGNDFDETISDIRGEAAVMGGAKTVRFTQLLPGVVAPVDTDTAVLADDVTQISIRSFGGNDQITLTAGFRGIPILDALFVDSGSDNDDIRSVPTGEVRLPSDPLSLSETSNISLLGGSGRDTIIGGDDPEIIDGGADDDAQLSGWGGVGWIYGGLGDDENINGGEGNDFIAGGDGFDTIGGSAGDDTIYGDSDGAVQGDADCGDCISGGDGRDHIYGGLGDDEINGGDQDDYIWGGSANDTISGGEGDDMIDGEDGDDTLFGNAGCDDMFGGIGADTIAGGTNDDWIWSNTGPWNIDQPYNGVGPNPGSPDIKGTGQEDCDIEDGHPDMDPGCVHPTAIDDSYMVQAGSTLTVSPSGVLSNDSDPFGQPLTTILIQTTTHGSLALNGNGGFVYTPTFGFVGSDLFWYAADNGDDPSNVAKVTITVFNQNPTAANDSFGGYKNQTINGNVLTNDSMANGAQYVSGYGPAHGTLTLQANGTFQYVPTTGWYGVDTFRYVATQSWTGFQSNQATVTINIINFGPLTLEAPPASNPVSQVLDLQSVNAVYEEAIRRWHAAGVPNHVIEERLYNVQFILTDLQGSTLSGATEDNRIVIDINGAGYGWFIDRTPQSDSEFLHTSADSELQAKDRSAAIGRPDLLTAMEHEVGHLLGLDHSAREGGHSLMNATVGLGTRRVPTAEMLPFWS